MKNTTGIALILFVDQLAKFLVRQNLYPGQEIKLFSFFSITYVRNSGGLFGLFGGHNVMLAVLSALVVAVMWWRRNEIFPPGKLGNSAFVFLVGGGTGNLLDRIIHGQVIDFLDFYLCQWHWPAFNLADAAVDAGIFFWLLAVIKERGES